MERKVKINIHEDYVPKRESRRINEDIKEGIKNRKKLNIEKRRARTEHIET